MFTENSSDGARSVQQRFLMIDISVVCLSVCLSVCPFVCLFVCLPCRCIRLRCLGHALTRIGRQTLYYKKEKIDRAGDIHSLTYDFQLKRRSIMREEKAIMRQTVITTWVKTTWTILGLSHHQIIGNIATSDSTWKSFLYNSNNISRRTISS